METPQRLVFGAVAGTYDANRPSYPVAVVMNAVARTGRSPAEVDVVDIGSGTGRVAELLNDIGVVGTMVEPDHGMAAVAAAKLGPAGWTTITADFETSPLSPDSFDLLTCGQAWHWIDEAVGFPRAVEVLRPGGWLTLFWNRPTWERDALRADLDRVYATLVPTMQSSMAAPGHAHKGLVPTAHPDGFVHAVTEEHWFATEYTTASWLELISTHSDHVMMQPAAREELFAAIAAVIDDHGGRFVLPYRTEVWAGQTRR